MAAPRVTIGVPTRNRAKSLDHTLSCLAGQGFRDLELRISDNASSDETPEVIRRWTAADPRIRATRHAADVGPVENFDGLRRDVESEYFMWLADDDEVDPDYVETCVAFLDAHPDHVLASGQATLDNVEGSGKGTVVPGVPVNLQDARPAERVLRYYEEVMDNSSFYGVIRRAALDRIPFRNTLGADWLIVAALAAQGRVRTLETTGLRRPHRWGPDSFSRILAAQQLPAGWARLPGWIIARDAFRDVLSSPAYALMSRPERLRLGARCTRAVCRHFRIGARDVLGFYASGRSTR